MTQFYITDCAPKPDMVVNGWEIWSQGCGWGANVYVVHIRTGIRESNFTSTSQAMRWCAGQHSTR